MIAEIPPQNGHGATAAEQAADSPVVETDRTHLTPDEHALIKELLRPGVTVEAVIPADATGEELWSTLDACVRGYHLLEARMLRLKPIIGRILLMFENKPSLYKDLGYDTYSDFTRRGVYDKLGIHHANAYECVLVARDWKQLGPDRYPKIGPKKLNILSKYATGRDPNAEALLQTAERMKVREFQEWSVQRGFIERGETEGATITITTNQAIAKHYRSFFGDGRVHSIVGTKDHGEILKALMQSFQSEIDQYEEQQQGAN